MRSKMWEADKLAFESNALPAKRNSQNAREQRIEVLFTCPTTTELIITVRMPKIIIGK